MKHLLAGLAVFAAVGVTAGVATTANAQYVSTTGSALCTISSSSVATGSNVNLTVSLVDSSGAASSGQVVSFSSQRPNGTVINQTTAVTNSGGSATASLNVGPNAGPVTFSAVSGVLSCQSVGSATAPASTPASQAPTSDVLGARFVPPSTGDGGLAEAAGNQSLSLLGLLVAFSAGALALTGAAKKVFAR